MSNKLLAIPTLLFAALSPQYEFPRDHFNHGDYQIEWWYYTGNLQDASGRRFGFELTFFRQAIRLPKEAPNNIWKPDQIYLAHLALSDIDGRQFFHTERLNRAGPGLAGASFEKMRYWNGNWQVQWKAGEQELDAVCEDFQLKLNLRPQKPPVIHGKDGLIQKGRNELTHYYSYTRLAAEGTLTRKAANASVKGEALKGVAWMDHEFFTPQSDSTLVGWDWFAIQLDNKQELMLYRLHTKDGSVSPFSSGTYVDRTGRAQFLNSGQIIFTPKRKWHQYPVEWHISIPTIGIELDEQTSLDNQELATPNSPSPPYWEGAVTYSGTVRAESVRGVGYLELAGYSGPLRLGH